jgi:predicted transcriptional regulator of viral defense system
MISKNPLTKKEFIIYDTIKSTRSLITNREIKDLFPLYKNQSINEILSSLIKKKYLINIERSKYIINKSYSLEELFSIATSINYGYIAFSSALYYYGLIDYEPFTIFIVNSKKSKSYTLNDNYVVKYINIKSKLVCYTENKNGFYVSTLEKTIFDCFYNVSYSGGYSCISKAIFDCNNKIDWNMLLDIYNKFASNRQCQITGYILDILVETAKIKIPKKVISNFLNKVKSRTYLSNNYDKSNYKYISKWKLKDNIGKSKILSWWY